MPSLLLGWNIGCGVCVGFPLLILLTNRIWIRMSNNNDNDNDGGGGGSQDNAWGWGGDAPDNEGRASVLFAYLWTFLVFLALCFYGNVVLRKHKDEEQQATAWYYRPFRDTSPSARNVGTLTGAVVVFTNMVLVLFFIIGGSMVDFDRPEDEGFWQSSMFVPLTFLLWFIFGVVFSIVLYHRHHEDTDDDDTEPEKERSHTSRSLWSWNNQKENETPLV